MNEPIDIEALRERWWLMLAEVDSFLDNDQPEEALARARAVRGEAFAVFVRHPELDSDDLRELRTAGTLARDRCLRARRAWNRRATLREARHRERERNAISEPPELGP